MSIAANIVHIKEETTQAHVTLVAVSKTKSVADILEAYNAGQRIFGENMVQELVEKHEQLPKDIQWHLVGHLQSNKVKYIAPFIDLIHSVDSLSLLQEINKQAAKHNRVINCLLQLSIDDEDTKFGLEFDEAITLLRSAEYSELKNVQIIGVMGIATNTLSTKMIKDEFHELTVFFQGLKQSFFKNTSSFKEISMGMSSDYKIAIEEGSTMIRLGNTIFGNRA